MGNRKVPDCSLALEADWSSASGSRAPESAEQASETISDLRKVSFGFALRPKQVRSWREDLMLAEGLVGMVVDVVVGMIVAIHLPRMQYLSFPAERRS